MYILHHSFIIYNNNIKEIIIFFHDYLLFFCCCCCKKAGCCCNRLTSFSFPSLLALLIRKVSLVVYKRSMFKRDGSSINRMQYMRGYIQYTAVQCCVLLYTQAQCTLDNGKRERETVDDILLKPGTSILGGRCVNSYANIVVTNYHFPQQFKRRSLIYAVSVPLTTLRALGRSFRNP